MKKTAKKIVAGTVGAAGLFLASAATAVNADSVHHVVKADTVWALSQKYGVSIKSIEQLNHIDQNTNMIYIGQDLQIPNKDTQTPKKNNEQTYVVQSGDSLWTIAQKFNTTVDQLKQLNGLTSNLIQPGQTLKITGQAVAQPVKTQVPVKAAEQPVQQKATVTTSQKAPVVSSTQASTSSVSTEKAAPVQKQAVQTTVKSTPAVQSSVNTQAPVASTSSSSTQTAVAPQSSSTTVKSSSTSTVQSSVASSSTTATTSSSSSQQAVVSNSSSSKQVVSSSSASSQSSSKQAVIAANHINYTVKSGDTLYTIAQTYGVTVSSLKEANSNLGASLIAGQTIIINNPTKNPTVVSSQSQSSRVQSSSQSVARPQQTQTASSASQQQNNNNNQAAKASSQAQASSTTRTGSGSNVVSFAESLIGVPYVYGGTTPSGFDCSGFVQYVYSHFGVNLPRTTTQQENCGTQIPVIQAQPGDLYFWGSKGSAYHVAICIGNGKYIAAPEPGQSVSIGSTQYFQPSFAVRL